MEEFRPAGAGVVVASMACGPIFMLVAAVVSLYLQMPDPIPVSSVGLLSFAILLLPMAGLGLIVSIFPNLIAATAMYALASHWEPARAPLAWAVLVALIGLGALAAFGGLDAEPECTVAFLAACAASGLIFRRFTSAA